MKSVVAALFFAALASAVEFTNNAYDVKSGVPFTLTWADASGPVTITLMNGPRDDLQPVETLDGMYSPVDTGPGLPR